MVNGFPSSVGYRLSAVGSLSKRNSNLEINTPHIPKSALSSCSLLWLHMMTVTHHFNLINQDWRVPLVCGGASSKTCAPFQANFFGATVTCDAGPMWCFMPCVVNAGKLRCILGVLAKSEQDL